MRHISVKTPVISLRGARQILSLEIGGRPCVLITEDTEAFRGLAVALQASPSVVLEIEEHPRFPAPEDAQ